MNVILSRHVDELGQTVFKHSAVTVDARDCVTVELREGIGATEVSRIQGRILAADCIGLWLERNPAHFGGEPVSWFFPWSNVAGVSHDESREDSK